LIFFWITEIAVMTDYFFQTGADLIHVLHQRTN